MKVALFIPNMNIGGAEKVTLTIANELAKRNLEVHLVTLNSHGEFLSSVSNKVNLISLGVARTASAIFPLSFYLRRERPDVFISMLNHSNVVAVLSRMIGRSSSKLVLVEHSDFTESMKRNDSFSSQLVKRLMKFLYPHADQIVCVSRGVKRSLIREIGLDERKIRVIYNPIVAKGNRLASSDSSMRDFFSRPGFKIVAAGRLTLAKGFSTLIEAIFLLGNQIECSLAILGEGELRSQLEKQILDLGLETKVILPGHVPNPSLWMTSADLFVLSSIWEGLPNVLIEAIACGAQVVSTDCPSGPSEILEQGKWGLLCEPASPQALATAIATSLQSDTSIDTSIRANDFTVEKAIDLYEELIYSLSSIFDKD